jgi:hypothetical protein
MMLDFISERMILRRANEDFYSFLKSLGWIANKETHAGFKESVDKLKCSQYVYWSSQSEEIVYHTPYYFGSWDEDSTDPSMFLTKYIDIIKEDSIQVLWANQTAQYESLLKWVFEETASQFCIVIQSLPDGSGLCRVKIEAQNATNIDIVSLLQSAINLIPNSLTSILNNRSKPLVH